MTAHGGHILLALVRYLDWHQQLVMTEVDIDGGRADVLSVSRAGYATEYEIKLTLSDFRQDRAKEKWAGERPHISRFYFVVPHELAPRIEPELQDGAGLIGVRWHPRYCHLPARWCARELRAARRRKARKLSDAKINGIYRAAYFRFWHDRQRRLAQRLDSVAP